LKLFDTSVLIASILSHRENHLRAKTAFSQAKLEKSACIGAHSLAEVFNVLTGRVLIPPEQARVLIESNFNSVEVIALDASDYIRVLEKMSIQGLSGGVIFDALIAECALKAQADTLYTLNLKHFMRLGEEVSTIAREPETKLV
jgi:predicted nucleic acid-binding protein